MDLNDLKEHIDDRVDSIHHRMDKHESTMEKLQAEFTRHEKVCSQLQGENGARLAHLDRMCWAILGVLASLGVAGICFAFWTITGTWPA